MALKDIKVEQFRLSHVVAAVRFLGLDVIEEMATNGIDALNIMARNKLEPITVCPRDIAEMALMLYNELASLKGNAGGQESREQAQDENEASKEQADDGGEGSKGQAEDGEGEGSKEEQAKDGGGEGSKEQAKDGGGEGPRERVGKRIHYNKKKCPLCKKQVVHKRRHLAEVHHRKGEGIPLCRVEALAQMATHGERTLGGKVVCKAKRGETKTYLRKKEICAVCNKVVQQLSTHMQRVHKMTRTSSDYQHALTASRAYKRKRKEL